MASEAPADRGQLPDCSRVLNRARFSNCHVCDCYGVNVKLKMFQRNPIGHVFVSFTGALVPTSGAPTMRLSASTASLEDAATALAPLRRVRVDLGTCGTRSSCETPRATRPEASHPRLHHVLPPRHGLGADGTAARKTSSLPSSPGSSTSRTSETSWSTASGPRFARGWWASCSGRHDVLALTAFETVKFAADLRMPRRCPTPSGRRRATPSSTSSASLTSATSSSVEPRGAGQRRRAARLVGVEPSRGRRSS